MRWRWYHRAGGLGVAFLVVAVGSLLLRAWHWGALP